MSNLSVAIGKAAGLAELFAELMERSEGLDNISKWVISGSIQGREVTVEYITVREVPASIIDAVSAYCANSGASMTISRGGTLSARF